jgi:DtxR family Mn-dependent transcriptional regulator
VAEQLSATLENYLETAFRLEDDKVSARPRDIASVVAVSGTTVTTASQRLSDTEPADCEPSEPVTPSPQSRRATGRIVLREQAMEGFLRNVLSLHREPAHTFACRMEHPVDGEALDRSVCFRPSVARRRADQGSWLQESGRLIRERTAG